MDRQCEQDGKYRYHLRIPVPGIQGDRAGLFIMKNPSTADVNKDDPTTRNLKKWAQINGIADIWIVNLYAYQASRPDALANLSESDAVGEHNMATIVRGASEVQEVFVAWGNPPKSRSKQEFDSRIAEVLSLVHTHHPSVYCIGKLTHGGYPRHPRRWYMEEGRDRMLFQRVPSDETRDSSS